jgi:hypothetical protein
MAAGNDDDCKDGGKKNNIFTRPQVPASLSMISAASHSLNAFSFSVELKN